MKGTGDNLIQKINVSRKAGKRRVLLYKNDLIFYSLMMIFPTLMFLIFWVGVNFNSIALAFQVHDVASNAINWTLFGNFADVLTDVFTGAEMKYRVWNGFLFWLPSVFISIPLALFVSYYLYKKFPGSGAFRVILYLPSIISGIVMVTIYQFFVERAIPAYMSTLFDFKMAGLLENPETRLGTLLVFNVWFGFGGSTLYYCNAMSAIPQEVVESARLDGATGIREFFYITLPLIYPILSVFLFTCFGGIFTNQAALYSFYGAAAPTELQTMGYYMFMETQRSAEPQYPYLSAMGLLITIIVTPLTLLTKWLLQKFGPSEE